MSNAIYTNGETAKPQSNLAQQPGEIFVQGRNLDAEEIAQGHYAKATTYIEDSLANNNPDVVTRDGSRMYAGGDYMPDDVLMINGMEVSYEIAQSLGLIEGNTYRSPQEIFQADSEDHQAAIPEDNRHEATKLLEAQLQFALGDNAGAALDTLGADIS